MSYEGPPILAACANQIRKYFRTLNWKPFLAFDNRSEGAMYVRDGHLCIQGCAARIRCSDGAIAATAKNKAAIDKQIEELYQNPLIQGNHVEPRLMIEFLRRSS